MKSNVVQKTVEAVQRGDKPDVQGKRKPQKGIAMRVSSIGGLALAQTTGTGTSSTGTTVTNPGDRPHSSNNPLPQLERPTNYGWIGLLGLAGLAGLLPRYMATSIRTIMPLTDTTTTSMGV